MKLQRLLVVTLAVVLGATTSVSAKEVAGEAVKEIILDTFADDPKLAQTMIKIARCEAGLVHRRPDGSLIPNAEGSSARGALQVLMRIHGPEFKRLGLDPNNDDDYFVYVRYLAKQRGTSPWNPSKHCWG